MSKETLDSSRGSRGRNVLDPELTQDYISQVSEEIDGRVTKNCRRSLTKRSHVSWVLYRNLTSFSLTHKCGLVPYFRERLETLTPKAGNFMGTAPQPIFIPRGGYFHQHSGQLNSSEADIVTETYPHRWS